MFSSLSWTWLYIKSPKSTFLRCSTVLFIGNQKGVQPGFLHVIVTNLGSKIQRYDFCPYNMLMYVCTHEQIQVQVAGNRPVRLVINQMSQTKRNTVPCDNLDNNTHRYRNRTHAWKRLPILKKGGKITLNV